MPRSIRRFGLLVLGMMVAVSAALAAPLPVMILDGESAGTYHRWDQTTPVLRRALVMVVTWV